MVMGGLQTNDMKVVTLTNHDENTVYYDQCGVCACIGFGSANLELLPSPQAGQTRPEQNVPQTRRR